MHVSDAPSIARTEVKKLGSYRNRLHHASKAQEKGDKDGADEIKQVIQDLHAGAVKTRTAISDTKDFGHACDMGQLALKTGSLPKNTDHPILQHVKACLLFGVKSPELLGLLDHVRQRAEEAADKAERRLDDHSDNLEATLALTELVTALPKVEFKTSHPDVRPIRNRYNTLMNSVRKNKS